MRRTLLYAMLTLAVAAGGSQAAGPKLEPVTAEQLLQHVRQSGADAVLVNVWATWCRPCREEMPDLVRMQRQYGDRGFELLLVSADFKRNRADAEDYLEQLGVDFPTFLKDQKDNPFISTLHPEWSGALPASFLYDGEGDLVRWWPGKASFEQFSAAVQPLLTQ